MGTYEHSSSTESPKILPRTCSIMESAINFTVRPFRTDYGPVATEELEAVQSQMAKRQARSDQLVPTRGIGGCGILVSEADP